MPDILRPCANCKLQRASGLFAVHKSKKVEMLLLCAQCGFTKVYEHIKAFVDPHTDELRFYHDVTKIDLLMSLDTTFVAPAEKTEIQSLVVPVERHVSKETKPLRLQFITDNDYNPNPQWLR